MLGKHGKINFLNSGSPPPLSSDSGVNIVAYENSFYEQVLPDASLDIAMSSTALHWLSDTSDLPDPKVSAYCRGPGADPVAVGAWEARAKSDWAELLKHRSMELAPGGCLAFAVPATDEDGNYSYQGVAPACEAVGQALPVFPWLGRTKSEIYEGFDR
jgi:hypothetical protein